MQNQKCYRPTQRFLGLEENYFSNKWSKEFHAHLATLLRRNVAVTAIIPTALELKNFTSDKLPSDRI